MIAHLSLNITLGAGGVRLSSLVFWWAMVGLYGAVALFISIASYKRQAFVPSVVASADGLE
ncbi:MAG: hypothetical protein DMG12_02075 [Acidobacteria bacterium]|nr:MAG: hypothetical protein DMG12_02075 [Acidobacteriota bacterium]